VEYDLLKLRGGVRGKYYRERSCWIREDSEHDEAKKPAIPAAQESGSEHMSALNQAFQPVPVAPPVPTLTEDVVRSLKISDLDQVPVILQAVGEQLESLASRLVGTGTVQEFQGLRKEVLSRYVQLSIAATNLVNALVPRARMEALTVEAFAEIERLLQRDGLTTIGVEAVNEALFCLFTLRRTYGVVGRIPVDVPPQEDLSEDLAIAQEFHHWIIVSQLHFDCLRVAFKARIQLTAPVTAEILDGCRAAVMAYACARRALDLQDPERQVDLSKVVWDEEDQALANESTNERDSAIMNQL